jgi:hypothetical protein
MREIIMIACQLGQLKVKKIMGRKESLIIIAIKIPN